MKIDLATAAAYHATGLSVLPAVRERKFPAVGSWKTYQNRLPSELEISTWFANAHDALCLVCGKVSGNLEVIDFDHAGELFSAWKEKIDPELYAKLVIEKTPSGGYHVAYRSAGEVCGNIKLAQGIREEGKLVTLIETRGEGGLFLCAPSEGYELIQGDFSAVTTVSSEERENLLSAAYELNEHLPKVERTIVSIPDDNTFVIRPGDDFNQRGDLRSLLLTYGWTPLHTQGENEYFRRPGKQSGGQSASYNGEVFYVFSSNAVPFEPGEGYSPFQVYAILEHNGDYTQAAKTLLDNGYGKKAELAKVDLTGIINQKNLSNGSEKKAEKMFPDPGPFPEELFEIPGFFKEYFKYSMETAFYPNKLLTLGGGLTFLAMLAGRVYKDCRGTHPNIYWVSLADSGTGKEHARSVNKYLAAQAGLMGFIGDNIASGEGLEDSMLLTKKKLFLLDEMDTIFNSLKQRDARAEAMMQRLLSFYSSARSFYTMRVKAKQKDMPFGETITNPFLVLYGTALPKYFYGALEERVLENGLIPRTIIVDANIPRQAGDPKDIPPSKELLEMINILKEKALEGGDLVAINPIIRTLPETDEVSNLLAEDRAFCDEKVRFFQEHNELAAQALWTRAHEKVCKLAILYAISENVYDPKITGTAVMWARALVAYLTKKMLFLADSYSYIDDFDRDCKKIIEIVRKAGGEVRYNIISRKLRKPVDYMKKLISTLIEREEIVEKIVVPVGAGRPAKIIAITC